MLAVITVISWLFVMNVLPRIITYEQLKKLPRNWLGNDNLLETNEVHYGWPFTFYIRYEDGFLTAAGSYLLDADPVPSRMFYLEFTYNISFGLVLIGLTAFIFEGLPKAIAYFRSNGGE